MSDLWRIKTTIRYGGGSTGDWSYYESQDSFEDALFSAALSAEANGRGEYRRRFRTWWRKLENDETPYVDRVVAVDRMVNDEWVPVKWKIVPPVLVVEEST